MTTLAYMDSTVGPEIRRFLIAQENDGSYSCSVSEGVAEMHTRWIDSDLHNLQTAVAFHFPRYANRLSSLFQTARDNADARKGIR